MEEAWQKVIASKSQRRDAWMRGLSTLAVCFYLLFFRVHDIESNFPLLGEQVRDWSVAQRRFFDLPLVGPRSVNSGLDIGPVYYWCLWAGRVLMTPILGPLPHTGGWFVALLETVADGVLLLALYRKLKSWWLATSIVVLGATGPPGASLSAVIWNPPVAEAFAKLTTASVLWAPQMTLGRTLLTMLLAICAVQCHASGILVAIPAAAWSVWALGRERGARALTVAVLFMLSILGSWAVIYMRYPRDPSGAGGAVLQSLASVALDPAGRLRPIESAEGVLTAIESLLWMPFGTGWARWALLFGAVALVVGHRDRPLLVASVLPIMATIGVFSLWQGSFHELYWFLVLIPAAMLCLAGPVIANHGRVRVVGLVLLVGLTCALQPSRAQLTWTAWKQPAYGPLAIGVTAAAAAGVPVRGIRPNFSVPQGMDPLFMFSLLGGRLDHAAAFDLVIEGDGHTRYVPVDLVGK